MGKQRQPEGFRAASLMRKYTKTELAEYCSRLEQEPGELKKQIADLVMACEAAADVLNELVGADYDVSGEQAMLRAALISAKGE